MASVGDRRRRPTDLTHRQSPAQAAEPTDQADSATAPHRLDDRHDPVAAEQRQLNQKAVELVLKGDRDVKSIGGAQAVKVRPDQWVQYGLQNSDNIFTTLVEFGDQVDSRFPTAPAGPQHNQIPQPNRAVDNSTYWTADSTASTSWTCSSPATAASR